MFRQQNSNRMQDERLKALHQSQACFNYELSTDLLENHRILKQAFDKCSDVIFREISDCSQMKILVIYLSGLVDAQAFEQTVLKPLLYEGLLNGLDKVQSLLQVFEMEYFPVLQCKKVTKFGDLIQHICKAEIAVLVENEASGSLPI